LEGCITSPALLSYLRLRKQTTTVIWVSLNDLANSALMEWLELANYSYDLIASAML
jgi:hypothetical protein